MALKGTTNEERIWNFCIGKGMSKCGAAGLMGNIYAESGLVPTNLQNSFEKKLGYTDAACPGNWLYSRYSDLANRINALLGSGSTSTGGNTSGSTSTTTPSKTNTNFPNTPFTVNVLVSDLNIRKTPNGDIVGQTGKGVFTITTVSNGWGKLKSGAGWIYLANASYCTIGSTVSGSSSKPAASNVPYKVRVDASDLRIRSGAGTNYPTTGGYTGKGTFTIVDEKAGTGSTKGWGKLKSGAGWISLDYCVKL